MSQKKAKSKSKSFSLSWLGSIPIWTLSLLTFFFDLVSQNFVECMHTTKKTLENFKNVSCGSDQSLFWYNIKIFSNLMFNDRVNKLDHF